MKNFPTLILKCALLTTAFLVSNCSLLPGPPTDYVQRMLLRDGIWFEDGHSYVIEGKGRKSPLVISGDWQAELNRINNFTGECSSQNYPSAACRAAKAVFDAACTASLTNNPGAHTCDNPLSSLSQVSSFLAGHSNEGKCAVVVALEVSNLADAYDDRLAIGASPTPGNDPSVCPLSILVGPDRETFGSKIPARPESRVWTNPASR